MSVWSASTFLFIRTLRPARADYWRTYNGQGEIGNLSAMTLQEVKDSVADPVLLELGLMGNDTTLDQVGDVLRNQGTNRLTNRSDT